MKKYYYNNVMLKLFTKYYKTNMCLLLLVTMILSLL